MRSASGLAEGDPALDPDMRLRLGKVAHDLNSPLAALRLQLFLHRRALVRPTAEDLRTLEILDRNVERMCMLVAGLVPPGPGAPPNGR